MRRSLQPGAQRASSEPNQTITLSRTTTGPPVMSYCFPIAQLESYSDQLRSGQSKTVSDSLGR